MAFVCRKMSLLEAGTAQSHRAGWLIAAAALSRARGRKSEDSISAAWLSETCLHGEETSHLLRLEPPLTNIPCTPFNEPTRGVKIHMAELTHPSSLFKSKDAMNWVQVLIELVESSYHPETTRVFSHAPRHSQNTSLGKAGFSVLQLLGHCFPGLGRAHEERLKGQSEAPVGLDTL